VDFDKDYFYCMLFHMEYIGQEVLKDISTSFLIHVSSLCLCLMLVHLKMLSEALSKTKKRILCLLDRASS